MNHIQQKLLNKTKKNYNGNQIKNNKNIRWIINSHQAYKQSELQKRSKLKKKKKHSEISAIVAYSK